MRPLFVVALVMLCAARASAEVRVVDTVMLETAAVPGTHALRLHLYAFRDSPWRMDAIEASARAIGPLLAQCGVAVDEVSLTTLEAPLRLRLYSTAAARELLREMPVRKPAVFFVDDTRNRPAYDAETIGLANADGRPELAHTIWVAHGARDLVLVLAHELVHLLSNSGEHSTVPFNLMQADTAPGNERLTEAQCARLRATGVAQGLLRAR